MKCFKKYFTKRNIKGVKYTEHKYVLRRNQHGNKH